MAKTVSKTIMIQMMIKVEVSPSGNFGDGDLMESVMESLKTEPPSLNKSKRGNCGKWTIASQPETAKYYIVNEVGTQLKKK